jgi:hypothetical protein
MDTQKVNALKTKQGWRLFQAQKPTLWNVGESIATKMRSHATVALGSRQKSAHIRRAHWHGFWSITGF